jgi:AAA+ superfamily predicted ATPase
MTSELFGRVQEFPDPDAGDRFNSLVGLDDVKRRLVDEAAVLLNADVLEAWAKIHHDGPITAVRAVEERAPLIILGGDVGTGKTAVAESVGHAISQRLRLDVTLYPLSLTTRGTGLVGQMTALITTAIGEVRSQAEMARGSDGTLNRAIILLIDEADSVAQSRELADMHHEDRAGVNALIQGVDGFRQDRLPVLTIMCTNRADAIDPAVARRAAHVFEFVRPNDEQRQHVLNEAFADIGISSDEIGALANRLGPNDDRDYGATYSDLRQRFVPDAVLDAFGQDRPLTAGRLIQLAEAFSPTRPFGESDG